MKWFTVSITLVVMLLVGSHTLQGQPKQGESASAETQEKTETKTEEKTETKKKKPAKKPPEPPIDRVQYQVRVSVRFGTSPKLTRAYRDEVLDDLKWALHRIVGDLWQFDVVENTWLNPVNETGLDRLTPEWALEEFPAKLDKVYAIAIDEHQGQYQIAGREWDTAGQVWDVTESVMSYDDIAVADEAASLVSTLFRPIMTITSFDGKNVGLKMKAGEFKPSDPDFQQIRPGQIVTPFTRYLDKKLVLQLIQRPQLTYILIESVDRGDVTGAFVTGLRIGLSPSKKRVQTYTLTLRPRTTETLVQFVPNRNKTKPLSGYKVATFKKTFGNDKADDPPELYVTDRWGEVTLPRDPQQPLVWIYVRSGKALVARVPFVPGIEAERQLAIPDDAVRLTVEGEVNTLELDLIDTVARRAVFLLQAKKLAEDGKWPLVDERLKLLEELPTLKEFQTQLNVIRVQYLAKANARNDQTAVRGINRLCDKVSKLFAKHLDEEALRTTLEQLQEMREADKRGN